MGGKQDEGVWKDPRVKTARRSADRIQLIKKFHRLKKSSSNWTESYVDSDQPQVLVRITLVFSWCVSVATTSQCKFVEQLVALF